MSAGLFIVTTPTHLKQDLVGWIPCYLHRRKTVEDIISNESSKCFLQPGNCGDLLRESGLTGWDYTIAGEREGWQKSSWSLLLFFFVVCFFPPTDRRKIFLPFLGQRLFLLLSSGLLPLIRSSETYNPLHFMHWAASAAKLHMHICTHIHPETDAQTLFKYHWNIYAVCTQTHMH